MGKEMAVSRQVTAYVPVEFAGMVHSFRFEYDFGRVESIWQDLKQGAQTQNCRKWLFDGIDPAQSEQLRAYLEAPDQTCAEESLMGELLPFLGGGHAQLGATALIF